MFEHLRKENNTKKERLVDDQLRERVFERIVEGIAVDSWEKEMDACGYSQDDIIEFQNFLKTVSVEDFEGVMAIPWVLRQRIIPELLSRNKKGTPFVTLFNELLLHPMHKAQKRRIAYHCSNQKVEKKKMGKETEWFIAGTEKDHRDDDLPMAYYSYNYKDLYRKKSPDYLYLVTVSLNPNTGHRTDGESWGRAMRLDIIQRIDLRKVDAILEKVAEDYRKSQAGDVDDLVSEKIKEGETLAV